MERTPSWLPLRLSISARSQSWTPRAPEPAGSIFFIVSARIAGTATADHAFRVGAAALHIGIEESGVGSSPGVVGNQVLADNANHIVIGGGPAKTTDVAAHELSRIPKPSAPLAPASSSQQTSVRFVGSLIRGVCPSSFCAPRASVPIDTVGVSLLFTNRELT